MPKKRTLSPEHLQKLSEGRARAKAKREAIKNPPLPPPEPVFVPRTVEEIASQYRAELVRQAIVEMAKRKVEGLTLYEPLVIQNLFHACAASTRLIRSGNRGGKTLAAAAEVARAVTGQDPYRKYPVNNGRWFCVGKNYEHVGAVMWRKLGRAGAYKIIRDESTGLWRAHRPWNEYDAAYREKVKEAPPLIPPRMVVDIAWESKKESIPAMVKIANGWEMSFYSSEGKPPHGSDIDGWWFDEEIVDEDWYPEMTARTLDRSGKGIWSATPQAGTDQFYQLHEEAERDLGKPSALVVEFTTHLADNPHIRAEDKRRFADSLSPEEALVRIEGEFSLKRKRVYPEFSKITHGVAWFEIPLDWTRYMVVDPGRQVCAVLFAAVPPPDDGDFVYLYDELYITNADAEQFGRRASEKVAQQPMYEFIIDHKGGQISEMGSGVTVEQRYINALRKHKVKSIVTGYGFTWGASNIESGVEAVRSWLMVRPDGTAKVRIIVERCPNLCWEMERYRYREVNGILTDKTQETGRVHQCANFRYLAMRNPQYVRHGVTKARPSPAVLALQHKKDRAWEKLRADRGGDYVRLGPGK